MLMTARTGRSLDQTKRYARGRVDLSAVIRTPTAVGFDAALPLEWVLGKGHGAAVNGAVANRHRAKTRPTAIYTE